MNMNKKTQIMTTALIKAFFNKLNILVAKPIYTMYPNQKIVIQIPYFVASDSFVNQENSIAHNYLDYDQDQSICSDPYPDPLVGHIVGNLADHTLNYQLVGKGQGQDLNKVGQNQEILIKNVNTLGIAIIRLLKRVNTMSVIEIKLIKLQYPYLDSSILGQYIAKNTAKYNFSRIHKMMFQKIPTLKKNSVCLQKGDPKTINKPSYLPVLLDPEPLVYDQLSYQLCDPLVGQGKDQNIVNKLAKDIGKEIMTQNKITVTGSPLPDYTETDKLNQFIGIKLELAGRLTTQRSIPRKTVSNKHTGSFSTTVPANNGISGQYQSETSSKQLLTDSNQYASKNKLGSYTIKV